MVVLVKAINAEWRDVTPNIKLVGEGKHGQTCTVYTSGLSSGFDRWEKKTSILLNSITQLPRTPHSD